MTRLSPFLPSIVDKSMHFSSRGVSKLSAVGVGGGRPNSLKRLRAISRLRDAKWGGLYRTIAMLRKRIRRMRSPSNPQYGLRPGTWESYTRPRAGGSNYGL